MRSVFYISKLRKISEDLGIVYIKFMPKFIAENPDFKVVSVNHDTYTTFFKQLTATMLGVHVLPMNGEVLFPQSMVNQCVEGFRTQCRRHKWYSFAVNPKNSKLVLASAVVLFTLVTDDIKKEQGIKNLSPLSQDSSKSNSGGSNSDDLCLEVK